MAVVVPLCPADVFLRQCDGSAMPSKSFRSTAMVWGPLWIHRACDGRSDGRGGAGPADCELTAGTSRGTIDWAPVDSTGNPRLDHDSSSAQECPHVMLNQGIVIPPTRL